SRRPRTCWQRCGRRWLVSSEVKLPHLGQGMEAGTITKWLKSEGDRGEEGEEAAVAEKQQPEEKQAPEETQPPARDPEPAEAETDTSGARHVTTHPQTTNGGDRVKASPLARRIARERGIQLEGLRGTGPEGRIIAEDLDRAGTRPGETGPVPGTVTEVQRPD